MTGFVSLLWGAAFIYCVATLKLAYALKSFAIASGFAWGAREVWSYYIEAKHPTVDPN
jgi:hypothetical protein